MTRSSLLMALFVIFALVSVVALFNYAQQPHVPREDPERWHPHVYYPGNTTRGFGPSYAPNPVPRIVQPEQFNTPILRGIDKAPAAEQVKTAAPARRISFFQRSAASTARKAAFKAARRR
jgi:hypothetical protein